MKNTMCDDDKCNNHELFYPKIEFCKFFGEIFLFSYSLAIKWLILEKGS